MKSAPSIGEVGARAKKGSLKGLICTVDKCDQPMHAKTMCKRHYKQANRVGVATPGMKGAHGPVEVRFWYFVQKAGPDECWLWTGNSDKDGYGSIRTPETQLRAHRVSFQIHNPDVCIDGLLVRHKCNNPPCVNPAHLLPGTHLDNMADRMEAGHFYVNEDHPNVKFSNETVAAVRESVGPSAEVGEKFGMSASQVRNIRRGDQRPVVGEVAK